LLALGFLLKFNAQMTGDRHWFLVVLMVALGRAFKTNPANLSVSAPRSMLKVTGRLTESLGGVRVVKGYHAEDREIFCLCRWSATPAGERSKNAYCYFIDGLISTVMLGAVSSIIMYLGARQILAGHMTVGQLFSYTMFLGFLIAPVAQMASIGTQITASARRAGPHARSAGGRP